MCGDFGTFDSFPPPVARHFSARISKVVHRQVGIPTKGPQAYGARCHECPLKGYKPVFGDGPQNPVLAFVGEAPGGEEESLGVPSVSANGELLIQWLSKLNLTRQEVFISNAIACRPPGNDLKGFLQRARKEHGDNFHNPTECCRPRLMHELKVPFCRNCNKYMEGPLNLVCTCPTPRIVKHKPGQVPLEGTQAQVTVALGNAALESLVGVTGIQERRGYVEDLKARRNALVGVVKPPSFSPTAQPPLTAQPLAHRKEKAKWRKKSSPQKH